MLKDKHVLALIKIYLVILFFYGIIIKFTIWNTTLFQIKKFIPEIIILIIGLCLALKMSNKITGFCFFGICWIILIILVNFIFIGLGSVTALHSFRDCYIPIFVGVFIYTHDFNEKRLANFYRFLIRLSTVYLITGAVLSVIEQAMGWEWTAKFYTGYVFYGGDSYSGVKISHASGLLRTPGLTGQSASFAFYAVISVFIIWSHRKLHIKYKVILTLLCAVILVNTQNKTAIIGFAVVLFYYLFKRNTKAANRTAIALAALLIIAVFCYLIAYDLPDFFSSFRERLVLWKEVLQGVEPLEFLFPFKSFYYGAGGEDFTSILDNAYIYFSVSLGIPGLIWIYVYAYKTAVSSSHFKDIGILFTMLFIFFVLSSLTTNITQGRAYFSIYLILTGLYARTDKLGEKRKRMNRYLSR